jgi:hypothetical protein
VKLDEIPVPVLPSGDNTVNQHQGQEEQKQRRHQQEMKEKQQGQQKSQKEPEQQQQGQQTSKKELEQQQQKHQRLQKELLEQQKRQQQQQQELQGQQQRQQKLQEELLEQQQRQQQQQQRQQKLQRELESQRNSQAIREANLQVRQRGREQQQLARATVTRSWSSLPMGKHSLIFNANDPILIIDRPNADWYVAKHLRDRGRPGLVPASYVRVGEKLTVKSMDPDKMVQEAHLNPSPEDLVARHDETAWSIGHYVYVQLEPSGLNFCGRLSIAIVFGWVLLLYLCR